MDDGRGHWLIVNNDHYFCLSRAAVGSLFSVTAAVGYFMKQLVYNLRRVM